MSSARHWDQDKEATVYVGNLDERVTDSLLWELMLQAGRVVKVHVPKDRVTQSHQGYGFVEFISEEDAEYAARIMNQIRLYGKPIRVNKASADKQKSVEVGAELFIGNLDPMATEQVLYETFSRFGTIVSMPKVARDEANLSKGYGFVSFADFEASDAAIANMNGQYLMNKEVSVQYAYKKDGKGERHGDQAERILAAQARKHNIQPHIQPMPPQLSGSAMLASNVPNNEPPRSLHSSAPPEVNALRPNMSAPALQHRPAAHGPPMGALAAGLPARPPPSQAGYGGPQSFFPPGFDNAHQATNFAPGGAIPHAGPPTGLGGLPGHPVPSPLPPGFQHLGNGGSR